MPPQAASGEWLGCFGTTEPDHVQDPGGMLSISAEAGDHMILNGVKCGSYAPFAQIAVVWAKDEKGDIRGLVVERGWRAFNPNYTWKMEPPRSAYR